MDVVEIVLIAVLVYYVITWIQKSRAWVIVKGLIVLLLIWGMATVLKFDVILWIFTNTIGVGITALLILFQPELRRVLEQLGQRKLLPSVPAELRCTYRNPGAGCQDRHPGRSRPRCKRRIRHSPAGPGIV